VFTSPGRQAIKIALRYIAKQRVPLRSRSIREERNETGLIHVQVLEHIRFHLLCGR
jgi:hypothetical protein